MLLQDVALLASGLRHGRAAPGRARRPLVAASVAAILLVLAARVLAKEALDDGALSDDEHVYSSACP